MVKSYIGKEERSKINDQNPSQEEKKKNIACLKQKEENKKIKAKTNKKLKYNRVTNLKPASLKS